MGPARARAARATRLLKPSAPLIPLSCSVDTSTGAMLLRRLSWRRRARAHPNPCRNVSVAPPSPALPTRPPMGGSRQRIGPPLAALSGDPNSVKLRERARCSAAPARAVATGQGGELGRRIVIQMPIAPPQLKTLFYWMMNHVVQKNMVNRRWAWIHQCGRGVARRPCPGGWTARGSSGSRVSSTTTTPTMMNRSWRIGPAHHGSCSCERTRRRCSGMGADPALFAITPSPLPRHGGRHLPTAHRRSA